VDEANSPTFAIINEYRYPLLPQIDYENHTNTKPQNDIYGLIHHIDLYRLRDLQEALDIGIEDYLFDKHYCLIEWGQIIMPLLEGEDFLTVEITAIDENRRKITLY
jgi:tRNA threonylcarbamoyladenosine biosynthesis protein TsaE